MASRMESAQKLLCLWPGLPSLWRRGDGAGLVTAILFAALLNFLLVTTFLWPELLAAQLSTWCGASWASTGASMLKWSGWLAGGGWWLIFAWRNRAFSGEPNEGRRPAADETLLPRAQCEYLRGHWFEAEALVGQMLRAHPGDVEARLLLAAIYRRSRRFMEASGVLAELAQMPGAGRWGWEIERERNAVNVTQAAGKSGGGELGTVAGKATSQAA